MNNDNFISQKELQYFIIQGMKYRYFGKLDDREVNLLKLLKLKNITTNEDIIEAYKYNLPDNGATDDAILDKYSKYDLNKRKSRLHTRNSISFTIEDDTTNINKQSSQVCSTSLDNTSNIYEDIGHFNQGNENIKSEARNTMKDILSRSTELESFIQSIVHKYMPIYSKLDTTLELSKCIHNAASNDYSLINSNTENILNNYSIKDIALPPVYQSYVDEHISKLAKNEVSGRIYCNYTNKSLKKIDKYLTQFQEESEEVNHNINVPLRHCKTNGGSLRKRSFKKSSSRQYIYVTLIPLNITKTIFVTLQTTLTDMQKIISKKFGLDLQLFYVEDGARIYIEDTESFYCFLSHCNSTGLKAKIYGIDINNPTDIDQAYVPGLIPQSDCTFLDTNSYNSTSIYNPERNYIVTSNMHNNSYSKDINQSELYTMNFTTPIGTPRANPLSLNENCSELKTVTFSRIFTSNSKSLYSCAFNKNGEKFATAGVDGCLNLWSVQKNDYLSCDSFKESVLGCAYSPDNQHIAGVGVEPEVIVLNANNLSTSRVLRGHSRTVYDVKFDPAGTHLATASCDRTVRIWSMDAGKSVSKLEGHASMVFSCDFGSTDSRHVVSGGEDRAVRLWDWGTRTQVQALSQHSEAVWGVRYSQDDKYIASCGSDRRVIVWDVAMMRPLKIFTGHTSPVHDAIFSTDGRYIYSCGRDSRILRWPVHTSTDDITSSHVTEEYIGHTDIVYKLSLVDVNTKYTQLLSVSLDGTARLWESPVL